MRPRPLTSNLSIPSRIRMQHLFICASLLIAALLLGAKGPSRSELNTAAAQPVSRPPIFFAANEGQRPSDAMFHAGGVDVEAAFGNTAITFSRTQRISKKSPEQSGGLRERGMFIDAETGRPATVSRVASDSVRLEFVGARQDVMPQGHDPLPTTLNYFKGPREEWITGVQTFARLVYEDLWPGIDLEYIGEDGALKYNFIVHPGGDPANVRLAWYDTHGVRITSDGTLEVDTGLGVIEDGRPVAFQETSNGLSTIPADFVLEESTSQADVAPRIVHFDVGNYDPARTLIIDPAYPVYAGFFGTSSYDRGLGIAVDDAGHAYITGETTNPDTEDTDAYVAKVALDGSGYDYISTIGGDWYDASYDIAVDGDGHAYITGPTMSEEDSFPLTMGPDLTFNGVTDILVAKLAPDGSDLVYAGYLGGELSEFGEGIRVDDEGAVYLHGIVLSTEATFPVKTGPDLTFNGESDAFVAKINPVPDAEAVEDNLVYSGYIGGDRSDITLIQDGSWAILSSGHIGIDNEGALYVSGHTTSDEDTFPDGDGFGSLPGADQTWAGSWDAYVAKVVPDGSQLAYATYIGGGGSDTGKGMVIDDEGHAYFTGFTESTEETLPVVAGPDLTFNGGDLDAIVGKLSPDGSAFEFLGYFGGDDTDVADSITLDDDGMMYIVGYTESQADSFPVKNGPDESQNDVEEGSGDAFVARLVPDPTAADVLDNVDFAGYIGGAGYDQAFWVGLDGDGGIYVVGDTESASDSFPDGSGMADLPGPMKELPGGGDGFVVKLRVGDAVPTTVPEPTTTPPDGDHLIYMPMAVDTAGIGGALLDRLPGTGTEQVVEDFAGATLQDGLVELSFDDFCDFAVGWSWDMDEDVDIRLDIDELGECTYLMQRITDGAYGSSSFGKTAPEDFHLDTLVHMDGEDGAAGLMFGATDTLDEAYVFAVFDDGEYLLVHFGDELTLLDSGTVEFDASAPVTLAVSAVGDTITMYVNGEEVGTMEDAGTHQGRVGTYIEAGGSALPYTNHFDFIRISEPAAP